MSQRCCSIHLEQCVHHPMCIELVTRRCDKVFLGMEQFLRREALLTSRDVVAAIEVTITGPNARVHSSHRCCMPAHFAVSHSVNLRRAWTNDVAMTLSTNGRCDTANIIRQSRFYAVCSR